MSIATVTTRGYGSFGSIADVATRGYIASTTPIPIPTSDTFIPGGGGGGFVPGWKWQEGIHRRRPKKKLAPPPVVEIEAKPVAPPIDLDKVLGPIDDEEAIIAILLDEP